MSANSELLIGNSDPSTTDDLLRYIILSFLGIVLSSWVMWSTRSYQAPVLGETVDITYSIIVVAEFGFVISLLGLLFVTITVIFNTVI